MTTVTKPIDNIGCEYISNKCGKFIIIDYKGNDKYTVKFEDGTIIENNQLGTIKRGEIKNPNVRNRYNVACLGIGEYSYKTHKSYYTKWNSMLARCYNKDYHLKFPTYIGCTVCEEWLNFQNFAKWCEDNYIEKYELDKDILKLNNKLYSPENCCFIPKEINYLINNCKKQDINLPTGINKTRVGNYAVGICKFKKIYYFGTYTSIKEAFQVYKINKELYIKEVAEIWKNKISENVYNRLINYKIEEILN